MTQGSLFSYSEEIKEIVVLTLVRRSTTRIITKTTNKVPWKISG